MADENIEKSICLFKVKRQVGFLFFNREIGTIKVFTECYFYN